MNFKELLMEADWSKVAEELRKHYDADDQEYKRIFFKLLGYDPIENTDDIVIHVNYVAEGEERYYDVVGVSGNTRYSLDLTSWEEWLGFGVQIEKISTNEFVAHCLWEMTFYGDEESIANTSKELEETHEKIKNKQYLSVEEDCFVCEGTNEFEGKECGLCKNGKLTVIHMLKE